MIDNSVLMKLTRDLLSGQKLDKNTLYLIYLLLSVMILAYIIPTIIFLSPSGTDVYTHMYNTIRMDNSNSLFEFYEKTFEEESLAYGYPFGLWFLGSIVMKVTGIDVHELAYIFPLILAAILVFVYYIYAHRLLLSKNKAILASIFLISMPLMPMAILQYAPSRSVVPMLLIVIIYMAINKPTNLSSVFISGLLVFSLIFTHTGTYMFLMFFSIAYFILYALIWKRFDAGMYILIVSLLFLYVTAVELFPYVHPQYINKGRMVLDISESISSKLGSELVKEMGIIFYDRIFVGNNLIYVIFWSSMILAAGIILLLIHSKIESSHYKNFLAIPVIGNIKNVSHGIATTPFWIGPVHTLLSVFGIFRLDAKGKCIALSLAITALLPGAMGSEGGTGALRELYYLFLIIPISSAAGFYYIVPAIKKYSTNKIKNILLILIVSLLLLPLISAPIIGNLYYLPTISGTKSEKENLIWLSKTGSPDEGAPFFMYRERISLYANKLTPSIPYGSEMRRYTDNLKNTYFSEGAEEYTRDLYSFNIKYIISSDRTLKGFGERRESLRIDSNKQLDKIYSADNNFGIYKYITSPAVSRNSSSEDSGVKLKDSALKIQDFGSTFLVENDFYKVKLSRTSAELNYIGTRTRNMLGEGVASDYIRLTWRGAYSERSAVYNLKDLNYPSILVEDNTITYKTAVRDAKNTENWATLIVKYTFYEKAIKKEVTVVNDRVRSDSDLIMNLWLSSSIFAPLTDFETNQLEYDGKKVRARTIYPSQDSVILQNRIFNELFLSDGGKGLFIKYGDSSPYPTSISYKGSTVYDYGLITVDSSFSLSPSEPITLTQYLSVGDKTTARSNIEYYTSVSPYLYPEARIPVVLVGYLDEKDRGYSSDIYERFRDSGITYTEAVTPAGKILLQNGSVPAGYLNTYEKQTYKNLSIQNDDIRRIKEALDVNGVLPGSFKYNLDTIKALSDNNILFAAALTVPAPIREFFREGLRHPKPAYYRGEETGVVLIPVTRPASSILRPVFDVENAFSQWKETLDSAVEDGGMAVFFWNAKEIGNPDYIDQVMELVNYSKSRGMSFTAPGEIAAHFRLIQKVSADVAKGADYVILNAVNHNNEEVKGITYRLKLPVLDNSCSYSAVNGRIPRQEKKEGSCLVYVSFDLKAGEQKEVSVEPANITRKQFKLDFSGVYEGSSVIRVRDDQGNPVAGADVYVDARWLQSDNKGDVELIIRRGMHRIRVEKPGFVSKDYEIEVGGRLYKLLSRFHLR